MLETYRPGSKTMVVVMYAEDDCSRFDPARHANPNPNTNPNPNPNPNQVGFATFSQFLLTRAGQGDFLDTLVADPG